MHDVSNKCLAITSGENDHRLAPTTSTATTLVIMNKRLTNPIII